MIMSVIGKDSLSDGIGLHLKRVEKLRVVCFNSIDFLLRI